jgi:hypothetical protein
VIFAPLNTGYAIFINALAEGCVPLVREGNNRPAIFPSEREAHREIVDNLITRLQEFLDGERDFEDAVTVEEFVVKVQVHPDGSIEDEWGSRFW